MNFFIDIYLWVAIFVCGFILGNQSYDCTIDICDILVIVIWSVM